MLCWGVVQAVVAADPGGGSVAGLVRQLSIDHFENEGRRIMPENGGPGTGIHRKLLDRQMSIQGVHKKVCRLEGLHSKQRTCFEG